MNENANVQSAARKCPKKQIGCDLSPTKVNVLDAIHRNLRIGRSGSRYADLQCLRQGTKLRAAHWLRRVFGRESEEALRIIEELGKEGLVDLWMRGYAMITGEGVAFLYASINLADCGDEGEALNWFQAHFRRKSDSEYFLNLNGETLSGKTLHGLAVTVAGRWIELRACADSTASQRKAFHMAKRDLEFLGEWGHVLDEAHSAHEESSEVMP